MPMPMQSDLPALGAPLAGGFYAGLIRLDGQLHALIVAPRAEGERADSAWNNSTKTIGCATSYENGLANTNAMAAADSQLAQWACGLRIGGFDDWYLPSQDELEILYRNLKPTGKENWCYSRCGINLSAATPTRPYTPELPAQTQAEAFKEGGEQAFDADLYWSSTQHAADSASAWYQGFSDGYQGNTHKYDELRARAVRRLAL